MKFWALAALVYLTLIAANLQWIYRPGEPALDVYEWHYSVPETEPSFRRYFPDRGSLHGAPTHPSQDYREAWKIGGAWARSAVGAGSGVVPKSRFAPYSRNGVGGVSAASSSAGPRRRLTCWQLSASRMLRPRLSSPRCRQARTSS